MGMLLKAAREASGKTQAQVAKEAGITERGYQKIEAKDEYKAVQTAILIARAVNSTVESLFGAATPAASQPSEEELEYLKQRKLRLEEWKIPKDNPRGRP